MDETAQRRRIDIPTLDREKALFHQFIIGQEEPVNTFANLLMTLRSGIRPAKPGPIDAKFLAGPSGVGKTELVYVLAELLSGGTDNSREKVIVINGGEYQHEHNLSRLLGSPPGYIGSKDSRWPGGTEPVLSQNNLDKHRISYTDRSGKGRNVTIILVDEAEKAHIALHKAFLSVLDKGRLDLADNSSADFSNTIILYTSNIGNQVVEKLSTRNGTTPISADEKRQIILEAIGDAYPPELRGRINEFVIFNNLDEKAIVLITENKIKEVEQTFKHNGINIELELSPAALQWLISQGYSTSEGVRAMNKVIKRSIQDKLILAHTGVGLHRKKIFIDLEQGAIDLSFYFNEGVELEEGLTATQQAEIPEELLEQLIAPLEAPVDRERERNQVYPVTRFSKYREARDKLFKVGLLDPNIANTHPKIRTLAFKIAIESLLMEDLHIFDEVNKDIALSGIFDTTEITKSPEIIEAAKVILQGVVRSGIEKFTIERNALVFRGIGTTDYWNKVFHDQLLSKAKDKI